MHGDHFSYVTGERKSNCLFNGCVHERLMFNFATKPFEKFDNGLRLLQTRIRTTVRSSSCDFRCQMRVSLMQEYVFIYLSVQCYIFIVCTLFLQ